MRARQLLSRSIQTGYEGGKGTGLSLSQGLLGAGPCVAAPQPLADPCLLVVPRITPHGEEGRLRVNGGPVGDGRGHLCISRSLTTKDCKTIISVNP